MSDERPECSTTPLPKNRKELADYLSAVSEMAETIDSTAGFLLKLTVNIIRQEDASDAERRQ
jgi:hypothetical protein